MSARYGRAVDLLRPLRRKRPRWGCAALAILAVPCLSCSLGYFLSAIPAPDPMPRDAVMTSYAAEEEVATSMGFAIADTIEVEHADEDDADLIPLSLAPGECVAAIGAVWGYQQLEHLRLLHLRGDRARLLTESTPDGRVAHLEWCSDEAAELRLELTRRRQDLYARDTGGNVHVGIYRGPSERIGGVRALQRGQISDHGLAALRAHVFDAADHERAAGAEPLAAPIEIESMSARLLPEDLSTYAELHRGALNGSSREVSPRFTPLPPSVRADWRPGAPADKTRTIEELRAQLRPTEHPTEVHPAVRDSDDGFVRVLAILDANRLGARCVDVQLVRMRFGERATVRRARAGREELRELRTLDNAAFDRVCAGQGILVYVTSPSDQERYTLRIDRAGAG